MNRMKMRYLKRALLLFEIFKSHKLTTNDLDKAENKAFHLNDRMSDFKVLIAMVRDVWGGRYKMNKWNMSIIIGTIVYVVSPVDAIPDFIPMAGWLDDVTIVGYALSKLSEEIRKYKEFSQKNVETAVVKPS